jgi:molybdate transport system substrate-binding protein
MSTALCTLRRAALALGASVLLLTGGQASQPPARERHLSVAAAADLKFALDDIVNDFRSVRPDLNVQVTYGSSGNFVAQLSNGAPFDVFFSADVEYVRQLRSKGLTLPESEFIYAIGRIVLWVPRSSPLDPNQGLAVLRAPSVRRIAIANPRHAPYGRAAEAAMKSIKVYDGVRSKLVFGENVAQAAQFVESGAADVGIIALSLASSPALANEGRFWEIPLSAYPRMEQGGAVLKRTREPDAARALTAFVLGPSGRATLERFGFSLP